MKITGIIILKTESAKTIAEALSPDNQGYMECIAEGDTVKASVSGDSVKTVLATVNDHLMNLSVACKTNDRHANRI